MRADMFAELVASLKEVREIEAGRLKPARVTRLSDLVTADTPDVARIRERYGVSQARFAALLGISVDTLQNWEQKRRQPEGAAKVLLRVAAKHPEALLSVNGETPKRRPRRSKT